MYLMYSHSEHSESQLASALWQWTTAAVFVFVSVLGFTTSASGPSVSSFLQGGRAMALGTSFYARLVSPAHFRSLHLCEGLRDYKSTSQRYESCLSDKKKFGSFEFKGSWHPERCKKVWIMFNKELLLLVYNQRFVSVWLHWITPQSPT